MRYIKTFAQIRLTDLALVGGKNASLGEMFSELVPQGLRIPNGFAITADGYWAYLAYNGLTDKIQTHNARSKKFDATTTSRTNHP